MAEEKKPSVDVADRANKAADSIREKLKSGGDNVSIMVLLDEADREFTELLAKTDADEQTCTDLKEEFAWHLAEKLNAGEGVDGQKEGYTYNKSQFLDWAPDDAKEADREAEQKLDADLGGEVHWSLAASMIAYEIRTDVVSKKRAVKLLQGFVDDKDGKQAISEKRPFTVVGVVAKGDELLAPAVVLSRDTGEGTKVLYVAVRGSILTWKVWRNNFKVALAVADETFRPDENVRVHSGFKATSDKLKDYGILKIVNDAMGPDDKVVFCGHSLGGVVAQMLAVAFAQKKRENAAADGYVSNLVTFGCPRGGNAAYQRAVATSTRHVRVFTEFDPVRTLPSNASVAAKLMRFPHDYAPHGSGDAMRHVCVVDNSPASILANDEVAPVFRSVVSIIYYAYYYHYAYHYASGILSHFGIKLRKEAPQS